MIFQTIGKFLDRRWVSVCLLYFTCMIGIAWAVDTQLSNLTPLATAPAESDELYISDGGVSKKITALNFLGALEAALTDYEIHADNLPANSPTASALAADPTDCSSNQFANAIGANGNLSCSGIVDADVPNDITVNLASAATALAANGSNCDAGSYALGVDANGAAEGCTSTAGFYEAGDTLQTNSGTSLPGTCTTGQMFIDTDADTDGSLYVCVDTNTWKENDDDGGAGGGDITGVLGDDTGDVPVLFQTFSAFTGSDATPDVSTATFWRTVDTTTITGFDGTPVDGQFLVVYCGAATVFDLTSSEITASNRATDYTASVGDVLIFVYRTDQWYAANMPDAYVTVSSNGLLTRTGAGTAAARTITGTANEVTVTNGDGVSGNPTISLPLNAGTDITQDLEEEVAAGSLADNSVYSADINTIVESMIWVGGGMTPDGTQCAAASDVQINSGPYQATIICADNDGSSLYGNLQMPDSWDASNVTFELAYIQTAADTGALNGDITIQCRGAGETVNSTWESEVAMDDTNVTGSNAVDHLTSGNVSGTCVAGDTVYWRWQMDATGTTTAVATLHFVGMKMEYTSNVGD